MITSWGSSSRAIAIMARWRMPPESWNGKLFRCTGSMETISSTSAERWAMRASSQSVWASHASASWAPIDRRGVQRVHGALHDDRDVAPAVPAQLLGLQPDHVLRR